MKEQQQGGGAGIFWGLAKRVGLRFAVVGLSPGVLLSLPSLPEVGRMEGEGWGSQELFGWQWWQQAALQPCHISPGAKVFAAVAILGTDVPPQTLLRSLLIIPPTCLCAGPWSVRQGHICSRTGGRRCVSWTPQINYVLPGREPWNPNMALQFLSTPCQSLAPTFISRGESTENQTTENPCVDSHSLNSIGPSHTKSVGKNRFFFLFFPTRN